MMLALCVLLALLGCAPAGMETSLPVATDKPRKMHCCMPEVFEIRKTGNHYALEYDKITTHQSYSYDFKNQRYALNYSIIMEEDWVTFSFMHLDNYSYFIDYTGKACVTLRYKPDIDQCIPDDYFYEGTVTVGGTLVVDDFFKYTRIVYSEYLSLFQVSSKDCIPVRRTETDLNTGDSDQYVYFNATMGIKDQSVFVPPDFCHKAPVQGSVKTHPLFTRFSKLGGFFTF